MPPTVTLQSWWWYRKENSFWKLLVLENAFFLEPVAWKYVIRVVTGSFEAWKFVQVGRPLRRSCEAFWTTLRSERYSCDHRYTEEELPKVGFSKKMNLPK